MILELLRSAYDELLFGTYDRRLKFLRRHFPSLISNRTIIKMFVDFTTHWSWHPKYKSLLIVFGRHEAVRFYKAERVIQVEYYNFEKGEFRKGQLPL